MGARTATVSADTGHWSTSTSTSKAVSALLLNRRRAGCSAPAAPAVLPAPLSADHFGKICSVPAWGARPVLLERLAIFNAPSPEHYCSPPALVPFHTALCGSTKTWCWNAGSSPVSLLDPSAPKLDRASPAAVGGVPTKSVS
jgi:hypothetical protein